MKKICFVTYDMSVCGGVEKVTCDLSAALADKYEVYIVSLCLNNGSVSFKLSDKVHFSSLTQKEYRLRDMRKDLVAPLSAFFHENKIDVAFIMGNYPGFIASACRFKTKTKLVFCDHGALMNEWEKKKIVIMRFMASVLCHKVVTLTIQNRNDYITRFHTNKNKVIAISNWIDTRQNHSECYDVTSKRIVSAGRFSEEKGFDRLIDAFSTVAEKHPDWHLDLFGDGEMMPLLKEKINAYRLENNIHLLGMRPDLKDRYGEYAMYVLPSHREGLPLVLLEAKLNRLPIVSFDIMTGPKEIVQNNIDGLLVEPDNIDALSEAMLTLINNPDLRIKMSSHTYDNIELFSKSIITEQWCKLIDSL